MAGPWDNYAASAQNPAAGYVPLTPANPVTPFAVPKIQADIGSTQAGTVRTQTQTDLDRAKLPFASTQAAAEAQKAQSDAAKAAADARVAQQQAAQGLGARSISAETRAQAIAGYNSAQQLADIVSNLRGLYQQGPGATQGIAGLQDYLPTTINKRFDTAGNAARGIVGQALGFTGGQLNTEREAETSVGPYLPQAGDRDEVIVDKINRLDDLANRARKRAIEQLGGEPDANGNIRPTAVAGALPAPAGGAQPPTPPIGHAGGLPPGLQGPNNGPQTTTSLATGPTRIVQDPKAAALIDTLVRRGASADEINAAIAPLGFPSVNPSDVTAAQAYLKAHPGYKGSLGGAQRAVPTTTFNRVAASPLGSFAIGAGDAATAGNLDSIVGALGGDADAVRAGLRASEATNPNASLLGSVAGGAASAGLAEAGLGALAGRTTGAAARLLANPLTADTLYGAAYGAGSSDDNRLAGAAVGALGGATGGMFGRGLTSGASHLARGVGNADVSALTGRGVPLTVGQALGGAAKGIEDRLTGIPVIGDLVNARRREGLDAFNRAAFDDAAAPLATQTNPLTARVSDIGEPGVEQLRAIRSAGYNNAVGGRTATTTPQYQNDYAASLAAANAIPNTGSDVASEIGAIVPGYFDQAGGITGRNAQAAIKELKALRSARQSDPLGQRTGDAVRQAEGALTNLFETQAPGFSNDLTAANQTNTLLKTIEGAVKAGGRNDGRFTPAQLDRAAQASAQKFGNNAATTARPFFELSRAAQSVLPSAIPDSGTAGRLALLALPSALGGTGAGAGYLSGDAGAGAETGLGIGALLALGGTRRGQKILTRALLDRPDALVRLGNRVKGYRGPVGMFGAGFGASLPALSQ